MQFLIPLVVIGISLATVSCGNDDAGSDSQPVRIRGGERLAWTQSAQSVNALRAHTFVLYVDDTRTALINPVCTPTRTAPNGYPCSGGLPPMSEGQHVLQLTSVINGVESARSSPVLVIFSGSTTATVPLGVSSDTAVARPEARIVCSSRSPGVDCYQLEHLAEGLGQITALAVSPTGQLLFTEDATRLRMISDGALIREDALVLPDLTSRIVGVAVDQRFSESRAVFVSWTEPARDGSSIANVSRYQLSERSLGNGATILSGVAVSQGSLVPLATDRDGLLYVALPREAVANRDLASPSVWGGAVLRLDKDGSTPAANQRSSPVVSYGYAQPFSVEIDPRSGRVWLGSASATPGSLATIDVISKQAQSWPISPVPAPGTPATSQTGAILAFSRRRDSTDALIAVDQRLFVATATADGRLDGLTELSPGMGVPLAAAGSDDGWYVAVRTDQGTSAILRLSRRQ